MEINKRDRKNFRQNKEFLERVTVKEEKRECWWVEEIENRRCQQRNCIGSKTVERKYWPLGHTEESKPRRRSKVKIIMKKNEWKAGIWKERKIERKKNLRNEWKAGIKKKEKLKEKRI